MNVVFLKTQRYRYQFKD